MHLNNLPYLQKSIHEAIHKMRACQYDGGKGWDVSEATKFRGSTFLRFFKKYAPFTREQYQQVKTVNENEMDDEHVARERVPRVARLTGCHMSTLYRSIVFLDITLHGDPPYGARTPLPLTISIPYAVEKCQEM